MPEGVPVRKLTLPTLGLEMPDETVTASDATCPTHRVATLNHHGMGAGKKTLFRDRCTSFGLRP